MADTSAQECEPLEAATKVKTSGSGYKRISNFFKVFKHITVEPTGAIFLCACIFVATTSQTLQLEKTCRVNLKLGDEICTSLRNQDSTNNSVYEKQVQQYVARKLAWKSILQSVLPCITLVFVGAWSDKTGRRIVIMAIPMIGEILHCISNIVNVFFFYELPVEVQIFSDVILVGLAGGWATLFLGLFCYIGDITTEENRTHRLGFVQFFTFIGMPIGLGFSGVILKRFGYYAVYSIALIMHICNMAYVTLKLQDPERTEKQIKHDGRGFFYFFRLFFDFTNIKETVRVVFKNGPNNRRMRICILLGTVSILFGPMYGEIAVMYMSTRYRFGWDELQFSIYQTYNFVTHTIGTVFSLIVFSKMLKWHDSMLGIISTISKLVGSFIYCFAATATIFYIAPLVEILNGTALLATRSIMSKLVAPDELGKVNSIFGLTENLMPLIYVPLYTTVYTHTMEVLPGAVFLMGACMSIPAIAVFSWLLYEHRKGVRRIKKEENGVTEPLNGAVEIPLNKVNNEAS
ncbi:probable peptidoglycan muropeptide transporter SLC46 isoform X1 [Cydia pomonella]|uniref:probable peptidoglycan muropeptide transporter SLC46 isoform X1 n=1 Tax=Cydia pomonella TaxID=82600 RepID=UPI002ADD860D|nr:probable peptidoglycan muropeptide transporter SLC46 isoform X1 [Cydia pomonella]XP_061728981.1 probable peptidoglycan muropeptide transporter SLC46 isoform X1 [Cydia pomonella]